MDNDGSSFIRKTDSPEYFMEKFHHQYESDRQKSYIEPQLSIIMNI